MLVLTTDLDPDARLAAGLAVIDVTLVDQHGEPMQAEIRAVVTAEDRKSTRLNSSHVASSYAVFCLKKKRNTRSCVNSRTGARSDSCSNRPNARGPGLYMRRSSRTADSSCSCSRLSSQ